MLLVLETDQTNAKLTFAELNVTGVHVSGIELSKINETYKPAEVAPQSAYLINSTGTGNFTLQFTDIPDAETIMAYKINETNHWIALDATTTTDTVTFTMEVGDPPVVFATGAWKCGDIDNDGSLTITDARIIVGKMYGQTWCAKYPNWPADVDCDKSLTITDARIIVGKMYGQAWCAEYNCCSE